MAYEIIAIDPDTGETVASLVTKINHSAAHMLMGSLGVDYDQDDEVGSGDAFKFTDDELSAAEEALFIADGALPTDEVREGIAHAQVFLNDVRDWLDREAARGEVAVNTLQVEIGFF